MHIPKMPKFCLKRLVVKRLSSFWDSTTSALSLAPGSSSVAGLASARSTCLALLLYLSTTTKYYVTVQKSAENAMM